MKKLKNKSKSNSSSTFKTIRMVCFIIMIISCSGILSVVMLWASGAITFGVRDSRPEAENRTVDLYSPDNDTTASPDSGKSTSPKPSISTDNNADKKVTKRVVVLDPGHGISSSSMSDSEKIENGWVFNEKTGSWGEWRHFKSGTMWQACEGSGCNKRVPKNGGCWYPASSGDRDTEPQINMNNALSAKKYLENMGYEVRLTRSENDNPSIDKRLSYCYPSLDTTQIADADIYVCIHSNAGGGSGSYYISLSGNYDHAAIKSDYIEKSNLLGKLINDSIVKNTELAYASGGRYDNYPELILFNKSPIPVAYLEIGFYDNSSDLNILKSSSDKIGQAIANGIEQYFKS